MITKNTEESIHYLKNMMSKKPTLGSIKGQPRLNLIPL